MSQPPQGPPNYGPQDSHQPYGQQPQHPQRGEQPPTKQEARAHALAEKAHRKAMRPWFKKKRFVIPLALISLILLGQLLPNGDSAPTAAVPAGSTTSAVRPADEMTSAPAESEATKEPEPLKSRSLRRRVSATE